MTIPLNILVTGGAGFIGSAVVRHAVNQLGFHVCNLDKLTYAGNLTSVKEVSSSEFYSFVEADICDCQAVREAINGFEPDAIMHLAAESHVDRSIDGPADFIQTDRKSTRLNSSHTDISRMPSSA